jgi:hypothetical protein
VTALLLTSFSTALPTPDGPSLSLRETVAIEARGLSPADKATYLKMKSLQAQTVNYESRAHDSATGALQQKDPVLKASYQNAAKQYYTKLCSMWTELVFPLFRQNTRANLPLRIVLPHSGLTSPAYMATTRRAI